MKLEQLIDAKVNGKELVAAPQSAPRQVLSLLEALKASVAEAGSSQAADGAREELAKPLSRSASKGKRGTAGGKKRSKAPASRKPQKKTA